MMLRFATIIYNLKLSNARVSLCIGNIYKTQGFVRIPKTIKPHGNAKYSSVNIKMTSIKKKKKS